MDGRDLYRHRLAADAIYRAIYQRDLTRTLGVGWTAADAHGNRELAGMPEELVRSFSKRTHQIDTELDRLVADGQERTPRLVKWAVHTTRKPKTMFRSLWVLDGLRHRDRLLGWRAAHVGGLALAVVIVTENDPLEE